jgi:hypothetical protein
MSRAERRAYKRMTKNVDPYAMPANSAATRSRAERVKARRAARRPAVDDARFMSGRFPIWGVGGTLVAGLIAFSVAWPNGMPMAAYVGLAGAAVWGALAFGLRALQRRAAARR